MQGELPPPCPAVVDHGNGKLRRLRVFLGMDVAREPDAAVGARIDRDKSLVVVVVDLSEVAKLCPGQAVGRKEPAVARLLAEPIEALAQSYLVGGRDRPDHQLVSAQRLDRSGHELRLR
jgi:hypothetical protein